MTTTTPKGTPTPRRPRGASPSVLIDRLERRGWGVLGENRYRGVSRVLAVLCGMYKPERRGRDIDELGSVVLTVDQLARRSHLSDRWVSGCLAVLDELGIIRWTRGAVIDGKPVPSRFEIRRRALSRLADDARPMHDEHERARRAATAAKLAAISARYLNPGRYRRRSEHVESESTLPPPTGGVTHTPPRESRRAVDELVPLDVSARLAVSNYKSEPASPAGLDNTEPGRDFKGEAMRLSRPSVTRPRFADAERRRLAGVSS